jgi:DNA-binding transcriptional ArsR family regulator
MNAADATMGARHKLLLSHALRVEILRRASEPTSPSEIAAALGVPRGNLGYHVQQLMEAGMLVLVRVEPVRGTLRHYYRRSPLGTKLLAQVQPDEFS